uniref:Uncharacterized protein n=1 Tax=Daphnia galeata TaxID=27404 RepID=A0A8J2RRJ8_9CRUS|nr:unnamed protein product [Daphnia galeata]
MSKIEIYSYALVSVITALSAGADVRGNPAVELQTSGAYTIIPQFISPSQTVNIKIGETARLPCEVQNLGTFMVVWKKEATLISAGNTKVIRDNRLTIAGTSLDISKVSSKDSGNYTCEINTDVPSHVNIVLNVLEPAKVRRFPEEGRIQARKGDPVTLRCIGEGNPPPSIRWSKPGYYFQNGDDKFQGSVLSFQAVGRQDVGLYECLADNGVSEPATATIDVKVLYPPEIEIERSWIHTGVHQEAYLTCIVHAEPGANVLWYREERVIVPSDTRILESSNNKHTLILRNVEEADFGLYSCTADNLLGRSSQNIELSGRPSRAIFKSEPMGNSADSYNLTWKIDSYAPIEEYKLMFRKLFFNETDDLNRVWKSMIIPMNQGSSSGRHLHHKQSYMFLQLETGSIYEATVTARNRYGTSEASEAFQFHTLGPESVPNAKNLEIKDVGGIDIGLMSSGSSHPYSKGINGLQCLSFALLAVLATKAFVSI